LGGLAYFGFIGLFLGPILLGIALAVFQIYRDNYQAQAGLLLKAGAEDPRKPVDPIIK
jgi:predicted PurR-regulated permease PerM